MPFLACGRGADLVIGALRFGVCVSSYTFVCLMKRSDSNQSEMQRAFLKWLRVSHETNLIVSRCVSDWLSLSLLLGENSEKEFASVDICFNESFQIP